MKKHIRYFSSQSAAKQRRLMLVSLDWTRPKDPPSSLGHASILANIKAHKLEVLEKSWSVNARDFEVDEVIHFILQNQDPQTDLALGGYVWNEPYTQKIIKTVKAHSFPGRIILGGPQVSYVKNGIEAYYPDADVFIRGYAEDALVKLMQSTESRPLIAGVHYANDPDLGLSALVDLEQLPSPYLSGIIPPQRFLRWETQRGCPFRCSFCQHRESDDTMKRRKLGASRIRKEIEWMAKNPIVADVAVLDPTFNSGDQHMAVLQSFLDIGFRGKLSLQCRMEMVSEDFLNLVEQLNQTATVVLEFGLQTIHKEEQRVIQRPNNMRRVKHVLAETKKRGIPVEVSLIFGLPEQTLDSFKASVDFCLEQDVPVIYAFPLMLLRGTPLHDQKEALGLVESSDVNLDIPRVQEAIPHVVASPSFTQDEWRNMSTIAESLLAYNEKNMSKSKKMTHLVERSSSAFWKQHEAATDTDNQDASAVSAAFLKQ